MYVANSFHKNICKDGGSSFSFTDDFVVGARDGQEAFFEQLFDMFPNGTEQINYDEDTDTGKYLLNGEFIAEADTNRLRYVKELYDNQITYMEAE